MTDEEFFDLFDNLSADQFKAAVDAEGDLLVEAGPGAGKTRTLVAKALANCHEHPIYILTFTTSAAEEIAARLKRLLESNRDYREKPEAWQGIKFVGTLHSWCLGYLRSRGVKSELIDDESQKALAEEVNTRLRLRLAQKQQALCIAGANPVSAKDKQFLRAFRNEMAENGLITYDDVLRQAAEQLEQSPPRWRTSPIFLIDEVQDSSGDDLRIYDALTEAGAGLWLVGDLQQAIYSFRHPYPADVWQWWGALPIAQLATNYRSSRGVVKALNYINAEFVPRVEIKATDDAPDGEVKLLTSETEPEMLEAIYRRIMAKQIAVDKTAVLCRTNHECELVAAILKGRGLPVRQKKAELEKVPAILWGALGFYRQPGSDYMAKRYLRAIGADEDRAARGAAKAMKPIGQMLFPGLFEEGTAVRWMDWMNILQVPKVQQGWFYDRMPEGWSDLSWDDITVRLFEAPRNPEQGTGVTVTTIHAAKGREWGHVLIPFCDQHSFRPKNGIEEERVFFVGASRAIDTLSFLYAKTRIELWKGGSTIEVAMCPPLERVVEGARNLKLKNGKQRSRK